MIIVEEDSGLRFITQPDHARFSAQLLELWRADGLPEHPHRAELLFAVREHDNGWREADAAPMVDQATGKAHDFLTYPEGPRIEIWKRGVERYAESHPYAALLILEHARALHSPTDDAWSRFLADLEQRRSQQLEELALDEATMRADYRFLRLADKLSLTVCNQWQKPLAFAGYESQAGGDWLRLSPFPLTGATTFAIPCRTIPGRPYESDTDLGAKLAAARWESFSLTVEPFRTG